MQLIAEQRTTFGKNLNKLRNAHKIPGVIFGKNVDSTPVSVDRNAFIKTFRQSGETSLVDLKLGSDISKVLIKEVQFHPVTSEVLHVNFHKVNLKEKIEANIPVEMIGDETNALVKSGEAVPLLILNEITIEALPTDLLDKFTIDISGLKEVGDSITIADLKYDKSKIELVDYEETDIIAKLDYPMTEEEDEGEISEEDAIAAIEASEESKEDEDEGTEDDTQQ